MSLYRVTVTTCDDATVVETDLTFQEHATVERVAALVNAQGGGCMPTMKVEPVEPPAGGEEP